MKEAAFNKVFSARLRYYLSANDMTQFELSKRLGVGTTSVSNWCKGLKSPRMDKVDAMCEIFGCRRSDLMEEPRVDIAATPQRALSPDESALLDDYQKLNAAGKERARTDVADLTEIPRYRKDTASSEGAAM